MAFDRSNQDDLTALRNEILNDPLTLGYAPESGDIRNITELINGGGRSVTKPIEMLTVAEISGAIDSAEFASLAEYNKEWVKSVINQPADSPVSRYRVKFLSVFGSGSPTRLAVQALLSTTGSRAEELFGIGTKISKEDWFAARGV
jgi:hypothetical protein